MMTTILLTTLSVFGLQAPDTVDQQWLVEEWATQYENQVVEYQPGAHIYVVSLKGGIIIEIEKPEEQIVNPAGNKTIQNADFLFSLGNDDYYLLEDLTPKAQPSETYRYSSAE
jgi:hypothetical protein